MWEDTGPIQAGTDEVGYFADGSVGLSVLQEHTNALRISRVVVVPVASV